MGTPTQVRLLAAMVWLDSYEVWTTGFLLLLTCIVLAYAILTRNTLKVVHIVFRNSCPGGKTRAFLVTAKSTWDEAVTWQ